MATRSLFLVGYDISDPANQATIRQAVKNYRIERQLSAYECWLTTSTSEKTQLFQTTQDLVAPNDGLCVIAVRNLYWQNTPKNTPLYAPTPDFLYIG